MWRGQHHRSQPADGERAGGAVVHVDELVMLRSKISSQYIKWPIRREMSSVCAPSNDRNCFSCSSSPTASSSS
eukprot:m.104808 g.104808  ORF g.104808 m.104808 type:complete len:73 (-) comp13262_c1_seq1:1653-1871(-)